MSEHTDIDRIERDMEEFLAAGDGDLFRIGHRVVTARLCGGMALRFVGPSGAGKSTLMRAIASIVPENERIGADAMSPKALFRLPSDGEGNIDLGEILLVRDERERDERDHKLVRTLLAEGRATDLRVDGMVTRTVSVLGPISVLETAVEPESNIEDDSRFLIVPIRDGAERRNSLNRIALMRESGGTGQQSERLLARLRDHQASLPRDRAVNAAILSEVWDHTSEPQRSALSARIIGQLARLVKANALLNHRDRDLDDDGNILATAADYIMVRKLLQPLVTTASTGIPDAVANLVRGISTGVNELARNDPKRLGFSRQDVYEWNATKRQHAERLVIAAERDGLLITVKRGGRGQSHMYRLADDAAARVEGELILPELPDDAIKPDGPNPQGMRGKCA